MNLWPLPWSLQDLNLWLPSCRDGTLASELNDLVKMYRDLSEKERQAKEERDAIKAKILMMIGDSEKATGKRFTITAGVVGPAKVTFDRGSYRNFRINWRKEKDE